MNGAVIFNSSHSEEMEMFARTAAKKLGLSIKIITSNNLFYTLNGDLPDELAGLDYVVFYDKDCGLMKCLENHGIRCFNSSQTILDCDNKAIMYAIMEKHKIPFAKTSVMPFLFSFSVDRLENYIKSLIHSFGFPMVAKKFHGSQGLSVFKIENEEQLRKIIVEKYSDGLLFQEFVEVDENNPYDIRVNIVGNEICSSVKRVAKNGDFRSNLGSGGYAQKIEISEQEKEIALLTAKAFGCDFCGVDILRTKNGPLVCEINSNPSFKSTMEVYGKNVLENIFVYCEKTMTC